VVVETLVDDDADWRRENQGSRGTYIKLRYTARLSWTVSANSMFH